MTEFSLLFADPKTPPEILYDSATLDFLGPIGGEDPRELRRILSLKTGRRDMEFRREILEDLLQTPALLTACEGILNRWDALEQEGLREKALSPELPFGELLEGLKEAAKITLEHLRIFGLAYHDLASLSPTSGGLFALSEFLRTKAASPRIKELTEQLIPLPLLREEQAKGILQLNLDRYGAVASADLSYLGADPGRYLKKHPPRKEDISLHLPVDGEKTRLNQAICRYCANLSRLNRRIRDLATPLREGMTFYRFALSVTEKEGWIFASPVARHGPAGRGIREGKLGTEYPPLSCTARSLEAYEGAWGTETLRVLGRLQIFSAAGLPVVAEDLVFCPEERILVYDSSGKTMEEEIEGLGALYRNVRPGDLVLLNQPLLTVGNAPAGEILANLLRSIHKKGAVARLATDLSVQ